MRKYLLLALTAFSAPAGAQGENSIDALADAYVNIRLARDPLAGIAAGLADPASVRLPDRSEAALAELDAREDALAQQLAALRTTAPDAALLNILLDTDRGLRICRRELWNVSHMTGWQIGLSGFAAQQPVGTPEQRAAALTFWGDLPRFVDTEIANLRRGLARGYSVPQPVVRRVLQQFDGALAAPADKAPLLAPARRAGDAAFAAEFTRLFDSAVKPALARYRDFLRDDYLPRARTSLGLSALPDGSACYEAQLRFYTTLGRDARGVYALGEKTVADNKAAVTKIGRKTLGTPDFVATVRKAAEAADNRFQSEDELLAFLRAAVATGETKSKPYFLTPVAQPIAVEPLPDFQRGSGIPSHYQPSPDPARPAIYRTASEQWARMSRGDAEVTAMHEAVPGHHLQTVLGRQSGAPSRLARIASNPAYFEGWGRYAEGLAEEEGAYSTPYAAIARRVWPGRGMVIDPGLHMFGWTREQAVAFILESGRFSAEEADAMVDRMAAMPAQMTAYDSGALEIAALRREAEKRLGKRFDIRRFHASVLEAGSVPLSMVRDHVEAWIAAEAGKRK